MLKLMYITNKPEVAIIAQNAGVDRIFVDMEYIGKDERQKGLDSVKNHHTVADVKNIRKVLNKTELLVRVNPIHPGSKDEIEATIEAGADIIMLPYFKTVNEVKTFVECVNHRCKTMLLVETPEAVEIIDEVLDIPGIDEIHIGLNDLSLGYHMKFMFELLCDGTVERLCAKIRNKNIPYGFGGIAALGRGMLPAEYIIKEHYRLASSMTILSRSFLNTDKVTDLNYIEEFFNTEVKKIRDYEASLKDCDDYLENLEVIKEKVKLITGS